MPLDATGCSAATIEPAADSKATQTKMILRIKNLLDVPVCYSQQQLVFYIIIAAS